MKIYLAGPMTGYRNFNRNSFYAVAAFLRERGHEVENPAEFPEPAQPTREEYLKIAIGRMLDCDCVAVLPNWTESWGASLEVHIAQQLKIQVKPYHLVGFDNG